MKKTYAPKPVVAEVKQPSMSSTTAATIHKDETTASVVHPARTAEKPSVPEHVLSQALFKSSDDLVFPEGEEALVLEFNKKSVEDFFDAFLNNETSRKLQSEDVTVARRLNELLVSWTPLVENIVGLQFFDKYVTVID
jgi:hypothetical protein